MGSYLGRYHRIQSLYSNGMAGEVFILDRKKSTITPVRKWRMTPHGLWEDESGAIRLGGEQPHFVFGALGLTTGAQTIIALDSNYVSGTSGKAIATRIVTATNKTLSSIYFFVTSYTGTAANVNDINWEIRSGTHLTPTTSSGGLVASGTIDPASATGWIKISSVNTALTAGTFYWLIIGDADGGATDTLNILQDHTNTLTGTAVGSTEHTSATTSNGWTTPTLTARTGNVFGVFSDGTTIGCPYTAGSTPNNTSNRKGLLISNGLPFRARFWSMISTAINTISGGEVIYDNSTPGGAVLGSSTILCATTSTQVGVLYATPVLINRNQPVRIVHTFSGSATVPAKISIGSGNDASLRSAMLGGGNWYYAEANGTTDWSNDDNTSWPLATFMFDEFMTEGRLISLN